MIHAKLVRD